MSTAPVIRPSSVDAMRSSSSAVSIPSDRSIVLSYIAFLMSNHVWVFPSFFLSVTIT